MRPPAIGNLIRDFLTRRNITEERVTRWLRKVGIKHCLCGETRRWLNRQKWLHDFACLVGFNVQYDDGTSY
jgi:hypothetical protein